MPAPAKTPTATRIGAEALASLTTGPGMTTPCAHQAPAPVRPGVGRDPGAHRVRRVQERRPPERETAESFRVSRGAVREALPVPRTVGAGGAASGARGGAFIGHGDVNPISDSFRNLYQLGKPCRSTS